MKCISKVSTILVLSCWALGRWAAIFAFQRSVDVVFGGVGPDSFDRQQSSCMLCMHAAFSGGSRRRQKKKKKRISVPVTVTEDASHGAC